MSAQVLVSSPQWVAAHTSQPSMHIQLSPPTCQYILLGLTETRA